MPRFRPRFSDESPSPPRTDDLSSRLAEIKTDVAKAARTLDSIFILFIFMWASLMLVTIFLALH